MLPPLTRLTRLSLPAALPVLLAGSSAVAAPPPPTALRPRIEVAFVLDATGSMGPYIDDARSRIRSVAADLATGEPRPDVRYALVSYRDKGDDFVTRTTPFTGDISAMHKALSETSADGGGDTPEAVLEGLRDAINGLRWTPPVPKTGGQDNTLRLIYVIGDAEPQHYADSPKEDDLLKAALARGIAIQSIICGQPAGDGRAFFERVAAHSEGRAVSLAEVAGARAGGTGGAGGASRADGMSGTSAAPTAAVTVGGTIAGTTRTYAADALRVDFSGASGAPVSVTTLSAPTVAQTGLLGPQLRHVTDAATFSDLWRAHTSLLTEDAATRATPPMVDFSRQQVLAAGGADLGLVVTGLKLDGSRGVRVAQVRPAVPGVRFYVIPAGPEPVISAGE